MELQGRYDEIKKQGLGLVAISYDSPETLKKFADSRGITFPLISDPGSAIIKRYGILNEQQDPKARVLRNPAPRHVHRGPEGRGDGPLLRGRVSGALHRRHDPGDARRRCRRRVRDRAHQPSDDARVDQRRRRWRPATVSRLSSR